MDTNVLFAGLVVLGVVFKVVDPFVQSLLRTKRTGQE